MNTDVQSTIDSELCLLGSLVMAPERIDDVRDILRPTDFTRVQHRALWEALAFMSSMRTPIDFITLQDHLVKTAGGQPSVWAELLVEVSQSVTSSAHAGHHARRISDVSVLKALRVLLRDFAEEARDIVPGVEGAVATFVERAESALFEAGHRSLSSSAVTSISAALPPVITSLRSQAHLGLQTGIADLDDVLLGLRPGELFIIGARPSKGKTAVAMQIALNVARMGGSSLFVSLEMSREELVERFLCNDAEIDSYNMRQRRLNEDDHARIRESAERLSQLPLGIAEDHATTVARLRSLARRWAGQGGLDLLVVDYIQLMSDPELRRDRVAEVSAISRGLKALAKELRIVVLALSQLSRAGDEGRPRLSHLRESGSIEQDADQVGLLYLKDETPGAPLMLGVDKNRHGRCGDVELAFRPSTYTVGGPEARWPTSVSAPISTERFNFNDDGTERRDYD